jgi:AcrR family transcriptional regulator
MRTEQPKPLDRRSRIEEAALALLRERGFANVSMLAVAKRAHASNETLYRWYGDKRGLMTELVKRSIDAMVARLRHALEAQSDDAVATLHAIAPPILAAMVSEELAVLDRAAAADTTGQLGATIIAHGREVTYPLIDAVIERGRAEGRFPALPATGATGWFFALLLGDLRTRRMFHQMDVPSDAEIDARASAAVTAFCRLVS